MNKLLKMLPFFAFFALLTPSLAAAADCSSGSYCYTIVHNVFGFDETFITHDDWRGMIITYFIPAGSVYFIFLGVSRAIGLHRGMGNIEYAIAAFVMLATLFTGVLGIVNTAFLYAMGQFAFFGYVFVFFLGLGLWGLGHWRRFRGEAGLAKLYKSEINTLDGDIKRLTTELDRAKDAATEAASNGDQKKTLEAQVKANNIEMHLREKLEKKKLLNQTYSTTVI